MVMIKTVLSQFFLLILMMSVVYAEPEHRFNIIPDTRPSDYEYAILSQHVYAGDNLKIDDTVNKIDGLTWRVIKTYSGQFNYFAALYENIKTKQLVLSHRGSNNTFDIVNTAIAVKNSQLVGKHQEAYKATEDAIKEAKSRNFHLSVTGHSLGALLAKLSVYFAHDKFEYPEINAVTFESPGSRELIEQRLMPNIKQYESNICRFDILDYVSYPNRVNTWGRHIGTLYQLKPMLGRLGWVPLWRDVKSHSIDGIVKLFEKGDVESKRVMMKNWPLRSQMSKFFDMAKFDNGGYTITDLKQNQEFTLSYEGQYAVIGEEFNPKTQMLLKHFHPNVQKFLKKFYTVHEYDRYGKGEKFAAVKSYWQKKGISKKLIELLTNFSIDKYKELDRATITISNTKSVSQYREQLSTELSNNIDNLSDLIYPLLINEKDGYFIATKQLSFNLPHYLSHYIDRKNITKAIWDKLNLKSDSRKTALLTGLHGLGGVGKTTLAVEAIHNPQHDYAFKGWFSAETEDLLKADYLMLGEDLYLFTKDMKEKQKIRMVKKWLDDKKSVLLIYDNAPDMETLDSYLPNKGHIIITSRNPKLPRAIEIDVMSEIEALALLDKLIPNSVKQHKYYQQNAKILVKKLGYLPLALSQAGSYIAENVISVSEYLELYKTEKESLLLEKAMPPGDKHEPAYITWAMNINSIKNLPNGEKAIEILDCIAYCYPEEIPKKLLLQYSQSSTTHKSKLVFNKHLNLLRQFSLVKPSPNTVSIHRLVHDWSKQHHTAKQQEEILIKARASIQAIYPGDNKTTKEIIFVKQLLPHAEVLLSQLKLIAKSHEYVKLIFILGDSYFTLGNYNKSKGYFKIALSLSEKHFGSNSTERADVLFFLGKTNHKLGDYIRAKQLLEKALVIRETHYGIQHVQTTHILHALGSTHLYMGNYIQAKRQLEKVLIIKEKYYGSGHIETANALNTLGSAYLFMGNYLQAKRLLEKALIIKERHYGLEHIETAHTLHYLGRAYRNLSNYVKSKELLERALAISERYYGPEHIETSHALLYLGSTYRNFGNYTKSKILLERALVIKMKYYSPEHLETGYSLQSLGRAYHKMGNYQKAIKLLQKALVINERYYGSEHIETARSLHSLGWAYLDMDNYAKSKELLEKSLVIFERSYGLQHINTAKVLINLGSVNRLLKSHVKSKEILERALKTMVEKYDFDKISIANILMNLGLLYGDLGNKIKKKEHLKKALVVFQKHLYPEHRDIKNTMKELNKIKNIEEK